MRFKVWALGLRASHFKVLVEVQVLGFGIEGFAVWGSGFGGLLIRSRHGLSESCNSVNV